MLALPSPAALSYALFALMGVAAFIMQLGPAILAGVFSYTLVDAAHRPLAKRMPPVLAKWVSLAVFAVIAALMLWLLARFLRESLATIPVILDQAAPKVNELLANRGIESPFETTDEFRQALAGALFENTTSITHAGGVLTRRFFHILLGMAVAIFCFLSEGSGVYGASLYDVVRRELAERIRRFMLSFERVLGAQVAISAMNTVLTAIFLLAMGFPHAAFLIPATFILGILPLIGNLLSNTVIVGTALTMSPRHAVFALAFLVLIHKGEYFLNSRIVGESIEAPMWQTLLGIVIGEALLGVPGILLAPALLHYFRTELEGIPHDGPVPGAAVRA